jgi:hypothetical protein
MVARIIQPCHQREQTGHFTENHTPFTGDKTAHKNCQKNGRKSTKTVNQEKKKNAKKDDIDMCGVCLVSRKVSNHHFITSL